jgi:hypothetical protein
MPPPEGHLLLPALPYGAQPSPPHLHQIYKTSFKVVVNHGFLISNSHNHTVILQQAKNW